MQGDDSDQFGYYSILIDKRWSLEDLYVFPRAYEQVYYALEAIAPTKDRADEGRINRAFSAFPWRGGYSAVGFYNQLKWATPPKQRPTIQRIQYASPGTFDLFVHLPQVVQVALAVSSVAGSILACNKVYHTIYKGLQDRKLLRMEVRRKQIELSKEEMKFVCESADVIAKILPVYPLHTRVTRKIHVKGNAPSRSEINSILTFAKVGRVHERRGRPTSPLQWRDD